MSAFAMIVDLRDRPCLVVGGGRIALRKTIGLLRAEARVTVIAPTFHRHFKKIAARFATLIRPFAEADITPDLTLVIGATDVPEVNAAISRHAAAARVPCNIVDCPELCTFIMPALLRRGDLAIAITTGGSSPRLSRHLRQRVADCIGPGYTALAAYLKQVRLGVRERLRAPKARAAFWDALFAVDPLDFIEENGWPAFRERVERIMHDFDKKDAGV